MQETNYWERKDKLFKYTDGVRQFFPLATEQLETIDRLIDKFKPDLNSFLDLGCGDGFLGYFVHGQYPGSKGVFLDVSQQMIRKARSKDPEHRMEFVVRDFGEAAWFDSVASLGKFDLVISGYSIHHIENKYKRRLYGDIFELLNPGGIFLNLEHVSSPSDILEETFDEMWLDHMSVYQKHIGDEKTREELKAIYHDPEHKELNRLESVTEQCRWLEETGFSNVDCYMKYFELALFGGTRPG